jgi:hypothetical protein
VVAPKLMFSMTTIMYAKMDEINIVLADLVAQEKLSYKESENLLDFAYDLVLDGYNDEEIAQIVRTEINHELENKENAKLL